MSIPLTPLMPVPSIGGADAIGAMEALGGASAALVTPGSSAGFGNILTNAIEGVNSSQQNANALAVRAVTGDLEDVHEYTVAATEAKMTLELTAAIRNKAVDAFTEILRMQA